MKMISTLAILTGSTNISLMFTTLYNFQEWPPIAFIILSLAYIGFILLMEWQYRRFRMVKPDFVMETASLYHKFLYLFAVGAILAVIKYATFLHQSPAELSFERYVLVRCFDDKNNAYFNLLYYASNYLLGLLYLKMFRELFGKYKNKLIEGINVTISTDEVTCAICMGDVQAGVRMAQLQCLHRFHQSCMRKWVMQRTICPLCKANINGELAQQQDQCVYA